jgi:thiosulfate/3-mercaptopyruvate sulfurtransferase
MNHRSIHTLKSARFRNAALVGALMLSWTALARNARGQEATSDPWASGALVQPAELAQAIQSGHAPIILSVAFPVLYRGRHIMHAINAGPTSKPEGIEALKKAVANLPKDSDLVIYCGCCPMVKCPNIRPAYRALQELGFTHVRVLSLPSNFHDDWASKDYPSEGPAASN